MFKIEDSNKRFLAGVAVYLHQAAQSLARSLYFDGDGIRAFYVDRENPRDIAVCLLTINAQFSANNHYQFIRKFFNRGLAIPPTQMRLAAVLLYDFNSYLHGGISEVDNRQCLRRCLADMAMHFASELGVKRKLNFDSVEYYNRNKILPVGLSIDQLVGQNWILPPSDR
jgi:hypothetical protein